MCQLCVKKHMKNLIWTALAIITVFSSCKNDQKTTKKIVPERVQPIEIGYSFEKSNKWFNANQQSGKNLKLVMALNRMDESNLVKADSILIPTDFSGDIAYYMPFPLKVSSLEEINKIILFSYKTQSFAAYENGVLTYVGPTSLGREKDKTPTGLFFTNWKAEQTTSTFNDEWELKWNFNIANKLGIGFHQYELPGYPASHSCLRLLESDAKLLYSWADQWVLENDQKVKLKGTPVIVFGEYDFEGAKPWLQLKENPDALKISESEINDLIEPYLVKVKEAQTKRENSKV
ncbi:MAG: hypothetical protein ACI9XR_001846 [Flavobacterium sp.]|jgi:hypothetical protein